MLNSHVIYWSNGLHKSNLCTRHILSIHTHFPSPPQISLAFLYLYLHLHLHLPPHLPLPYPLNERQKERKGPHKSKRCRGRADGERHYTRDVDEGKTHGGGKKGEDEDLSLGTCTGRRRGGRREGSYRGLMKDKQKWDGEETVGEVHVRVLTVCECE